MNLSITRNIGKYKMTLNRTLTDLDMEHEFWKISRAKLSINCLRMIRDFIDTDQEAAYRDRQYASTFMTRAEYVHNNIIRKLTIESDQFNTDSLMDYIETAEV